MSRKIKLFIAVSVDGFIATKEGDISFLNQVDMPGEDYGYSEFMNTIDTILMGRKTYEKVLSLGQDFTQIKKTILVITKNPEFKNYNNVYFRNDLMQTIQEQLNTTGGDIFCDGGAEIIQQLINAGLVSEITLSIIPVLLGDGIRLFDNGLTPHNLTLIDSKSFTSGLVQLKYTLSLIS
jgi:dihydrofolate reductase